MKKIPLYCPYGNITDIKYLGVNPDGIPDKDTCAPTKDNQKCLDAINPEFVKSVQAGVSAAATKDYVHPFKHNDIFVDDSKTPEECKNGNAYLYVQYSCLQDKETLHTKYRQVSLISCLSIFVASLFIIVVYFVKKNSQMKQLDWDISTITPGDYTLQLEITADAYKWFLTEIYEKNDFESQGISRAYALKEYMKAELEALLTRKLQ